MRHYMQLKCFEMRQLYANKMFQNETIIIRIKCFKMRQLYANIMFPNETIKIK